MPLNGVIPHRPTAGGFGRVWYSLPNQLLGTYAVGPLICVVAAAWNSHWVLGFKQSSFRRVTQVSRGTLPYTSSGIPAFPPCYGPLRLSRPGKAGDLEVIPPNLPGL